MATPTDVLKVALPLLAGATLIALAALVLKKGGGHLHTRLFGALFLFSGIKSVGDGLMSRFRDGEAAFYVADRMHATSPLFPDGEAWVAITQVCALALLPLLFVFCASFPHPAPWMRRPRLVLGASFLPSLVVGILVFTADRHALAWQPMRRFDLIDVFVGFNVIATGMTVAALVLLLRAFRKSPDHIERQQAAYVAIGFLPSFVSTWVIAAMFVRFNLDRMSHGARFVEVNEVVLHFASPIAETLAAGLVAFAILKYNILGVQPGFRVGVKSAIVGFVFVLVFLLTQGIENIVLQGQLFAFAGEYGSFLLSGTTSMVLFKPIERLSGKVSDRLLPKPAEGDAALTRAAEVYHAQCTYVLRDGSVSEREMAFLRNLRTQLGLTEAQARAIEEKVERVLKVDAPQTGAMATTFVSHPAAAEGELVGRAPTVDRSTALTESPPSASGPDPPAGP